MGHTNNNYLKTDVSNQNTLNNIVNIKYESISFLQIRQVLGLQGLLHQRRLSGPGRRRQQHRGGRVGVGLWDHQQGRNRHRVRQVHGLQGEGGKAEGRKEPC